MVVPFKIPKTFLILFVAKPSLIVLRIGIPPATAASNSRLTLFFSASLDKLSPCLAISALFGVITFILFFKAFSTIFFEMPSDKPIVSNKISISFFLIISNGFL